MQTISNTLGIRSNISLFSSKLLNIHVHFPFFLQKLIIQSNQNYLPTYTSSPHLQYLINIFFVSWKEVQNNTEGSGPLKPLKYKCISNFIGH